MKKLSESETTHYLKELDNWNIKNGELQKEFGFKDFNTAFKFMTQLAEIANSLKHHPDWSNSYNKVFIRLVTHQAKGLTKNDFTFAKAADETATELQR
jgi:4a-hydroxytetrahydrobiopterin dehydratase